MLQYRINKTTFRFCKRTYAHQSSSCPSTAFLTMPLKPVAVSNFTHLFSYSPSTSFIIIFLHFNLNTVLESISQLKFNLRETFVTLFDRQFNPILILFDFVKTSPWNLCSTKLFSINLLNKRFGFLVVTTSYNAQQCT